jgi:hypothetical protein
MSTALLNSIWGIAPLNIKPMKLLNSIQFKPIAKNGSFTGINLVLAKTGRKYMYINPNVRPSNNVHVLDCKGYSA